jgi:hypothetical protein
MPPFAGTAAEVEALAQWIGWEAAGAPGHWAPPASATEHVSLADIQRWLDEAGTAPGEHDRSRREVAP